MLLALGLLLLLPFAGALRQEKSLFVSSNFSEAGLANKSASLLGFTVTRVLEDGEVERITRWKGLCVKETIVNWGNTNVTLRQVWLEGSRRKLQLIYEGGTLNDCIDEAFAKGDDEGSCLSGLHFDDYNDEARMEVFEKNEKGSTTPPKFSWLLSAAELRHRCSHVVSREHNRVAVQQRRHGLTEREDVSTCINGGCSYATYRSEKVIGVGRRLKRGLQEMVIAPGTKWCGPRHLASSYKQLGALDTLDRCCRRHDHCRRAIPPFSQRYNIFNYMPFTLSHCGCDQRDFHSLMSIVNGNRKRQRGRSRGRRELFLIPGTQWCGRGHRATKYTNLGGFGTADACCRRHDTACPFYIPAFKTRYGLFNWGISTIMHCACDERFRTCLKMAGTSSANFIGKIFFNIVQTKCFVLKPQKVCSKRSWWGKCEYHEYRKQAYLRDNISY